MNKGFAYLAIAVLLCCITDTTAQNDISQTKAKESASDKEFKVKTELLEVRAVVVDKKGQIIENLKKEDFELLEDDRPQEISFFSVSQVASERSKAADSDQDKQAATESTRERLSKSPLRTTLLFVDNLHMSFSSLNWAKEALRQFIKERLTEQDAVALATSGQTLGVAQQFTRNRQLLSYAIEQIRLGPGTLDSFFTPVLAAGVMADHQDAYRLAVDIVRREENIECPCSYLRSRARARAMQILTDASFARRTTLSMLKEFAEQMMRLPGKRMIVIFSDGFTLLDTDGGTHIHEIQSAIDRAVRSGVAIYSIDAKGLQPPPTIDASRKYISADDGKHPWVGAPIPADVLEQAGLPDDQLKEFCEEDQNNPNPMCYAPAPEQLTASVSLSEREEENALTAIAEQTGGKMYSGTNDLKGALGKAFDANRFYYVLSYYLKPGKDDSRFRNIKVRIRNHPEYIVRSPRGFLPADTTAKSEAGEAMTPQQRLIRAMNAPLPLTDLGVSAQADFVETEGDDKQATLTVYFDGDRLQYRQKDQQNSFELEILYVINDSTGKQVDAISAHVNATLSAERVMQAKTSGFRFSRRLMLQPGVYQLRIGVREEGTDRMGTAFAWVEVPTLVKNRLEMSSLMLRSPLDTDPTSEEGINVSELEQVRMVQGIPLYEQNDFCDYTFRVYPGAQTTPASKMEWMSELLRDGKPINQGQWQPIPADQMEVDGKGWFDVDGEVDSGKYGPGVYELRVSVKNSSSNKTVQRSAVFGVE